MVIPNGTYTSEDSPLTPLNDKKTCVAYVSGSQFPHSAVKNETIKLTGKWLELEIIIL